jgi:PEP-CTERM motif-containing protein
MKRPLGSNVWLAGTILALLLGLSFPLSATASPVLGQQVYYEGGNVQVKVMSYDASYTSNLILFSTPTPLVIANSSQVGTVVDLGNLATLYGILPGTELIFGILVLNTGHTFLMGPGTRNLDGLAHVTVDYAEGHYSDLANLGFEDLFGGGDQDYNDARFQLLGGVGLASVPEPSSLLLLLFGVAGVSLVSRSLSRMARRDATGSALR